MKSLEIVNDKIAELKDTYQHYTAVEKDKAKSSFAKFDIEQFQQIQQDLEVLEILRKHLWVSEKWIGSEIKSDLDASIEEEYNKVKQWLEENNYDR